MNECYFCEHKRNVPGHAHVYCANADPEMTGADWGVRNGWFFYPLIYDPIWKNKSCNNFKKKLDD